MTTSIRSARPFRLLLLAPALVSLPACTDLTETPSSSITPVNYYRNEQEVLAGLAAVYAQLRNTLWGYYNLSEVTTDEMIVPTRGQDWYDNGVWLEEHRQTWTANSPLGLGDINGVWLDAYGGIQRANVLLEALEKVTVANQAVIKSEARVLRAYYYYQLMDFFGGVPLADSSTIKPRERATRAEVFDFIRTELDAARADLPNSWPAESHGRMTKSAADAILANMYLNAGVFTKDQGINATGYNTCRGVQVGGQDACDAAIAAADRILNSGAYSLASDWRANFSADNYQSPENILVVKNTNQDGLGLNFVMRALHYAQFTPSPWNGFATLAETYNTFDPNDQRRQVFLVGPQVSLETNQPVNDRTGQRLVFTTDIPDATQATEGNGARPLKWPPDPKHVGPDNGNDVAYFRLGEIYLIKAEALVEAGNAGAAVPLVNALRARAFNPAQPVGAVNRDVILRERLFELYGEAKRRQDLIRFGKYLDQWSTAIIGGKQDRRADIYRVLMPIPQTQLDANPLLTQNPGY